MAITAQTPPQFLNAPENVSTVSNWQAFAQQTKKNWIPLDVQSTQSGLFATIQTFTVKKRGLIGAFRVVLEVPMQLALNSGTAALMLGYPYNLLKRCVFRVNGQNIISCSGLDLFVRNQIRSDHFAGTKAITTFPTGTSQTNTLRIPWYVPIEVDPYTMGGVIFAETDASTFEFELTWAPVSDAFALAGGATVAPNPATGAVVKVLQKSYDLPPTTNSKGQPAVLVPDLSRVHNIISQDQNVTTNGLNNFNIQRPTGQLMRMWGGLYNGNAGDWADPSAFSSIGLSWGGNIQPLMYRPAYMLSEENAEDYNGPLTPNQWCLDMVAENAVRDAVLPRSVQDLQANIDYGTSLTINSGAQQHFCQETLVPVASSAA